MFATVVFSFFFIILVVSSVVEGYCENPNEVYNYCGNGCQKTCSSIEQYCAPNNICNPGCYCAEGFARNYYGYCIPIDQCHEDLDIPSRNPPYSFPSYTNGRRSDSNPEYLMSIDTEGSENPSNIQTKDNIGLSYTSNSKSKLPHWKTSLSSSAIPTPIPITRRQKSVNKKDLTSDDVKSIPSSESSEFYTNSKLFKNIQKRAVPPPVPIMRRTLSADDELEKDNTNLVSQENLNNSPAPYVFGNKIHPLSQKRRLNGDIPPEIHSKRFDSPQFLEQYSGTPIMDNQILDESSITQNFNLPPELRRDYYKDKYTQFLGHSLGDQILDERGITQNLNLPPQSRRGYDRDSDSLYLGHSLGDQIMGDQILDGRGITQNLNLPPQSRRGYDRDRDSLYLGHSLGDQIIGDQMLNERGITQNLNLSPDLRRGYDRDRYSLYLGHSLEDQIMGDQILDERGISQNLNLPSESRRGYDRDKYSLYSGHLLGDQIMGDQILDERGISQNLNLPSESRRGDDRDRYSLYFGHSLGDQIMADQTSDERAISQSLNLPIGLRRIYDRNGYDQLLRQSLGDQFFDQQSLGNQFTGNQMLDQNSLIQNANLLAEMSRRAYGYDYFIRPTMSSSMGQLMGPYMGQSLGSQYFGDAVSDNSLSHTFNIPPGINIPGTTRRGLLSFKSGKTFSAHPGGLPGVLNHNWLNYGPGFWDRANWVNGYQPIGYSYGYGGIPYVKAG